MSHGAEVLLRVDAGIMAQRAAGNCIESSSAKTVTSLLTLLSVLVQVALIVGDTGSVIRAGYLFSVIRAET